MTALKEHFLVGIFKNASVTHGISIIKIMIIAHYPTWKPVMHVCQLAV